MWELLDDEGKRLGMYDTVVIAIPAPQAVNLLDDGEVFKERIEKVEIAPCIALFGHFPPSIYEEFQFDGAFVNDSNIRWACRNNSKPGRPIIDDGDCWMIHSTPEWAAENYEQDKEFLKEELLKEFSLALYNDESKLFVEDVHIKKWRYSIPTVEVGEQYLWNGDRRLGLCGDWCANSKVQAAYLSGLHLANTIIETE